MEDTTIIVRFAEIPDLDKLTELHCASFQPEDHVSVMIGPQYVKATYRWLISSPDAYTLVAEIDGKIIGTVAVSDRPYTRPIFMACLGEFIMSICKKPSLLFQVKLWKRLLRQSKTTKKGRMIAQYTGMAQLTIVVVDADHRGAGIFPILIESAESTSKSRNSRGIRAGVYKTNWPSRRAFMKVNWVETPELETEETIFYVSYLDPLFPKELGILLPIK